MELWQDLHSLKENTFQFMVDGLMTVVATISGILKQSSKVVYFSKMYSMITCEMSILESLYYSSNYKQTKTK